MHLISLLSTQCVLNNQMRSKNRMSVFSFFCLCLKLHFPCSLGSTAACCFREDITIWKGHRKAICHPRGGCIQVSSTVLSLLLHPRLNASYQLPWMVFLHSPCLPGALQEDRTSAIALWSQELYKDAQKSLWLEASSDLQNYTCFYPQILTAFSYSVHFCQYCSACCSPGSGECKHFLLLFKDCLLGESRFFCLPVMFQ